MSDTKSDKQARVMRILLETLAENMIDEGVWTWRIPHENGDTFVVTRELRTRNSNRDECSFAVGPSRAIPINEATTAADTHPKNCACKSCSGLLRTHVQAVADFARELEKQIVTLKQLTRSLDQTSCGHSGELRGHSERMNKIENSIIQAGSENRNERGDLIRRIIAVERREPQVDEGGAKTVARVTGRLDNHEGRITNLEQTVAELARIIHPQDRGPFTEQAAR